MAIDSRSSLAWVQGYSERHCLFVKIAKKVDLAIGVLGESRTDGDFNVVCGSWFQLKGDENGIIGTNIERNW